MRFVAAFAAALLLLACSAQAALLYGTYTPNNITFVDLNYWVNTWNPPAKAKMMAVTVYNVGWSADDGPATAEALEFLWQAENAVPVLTWMPYPYASWLSPTPNADIVSGQYDAYIDQFLAALNKWLSGPDGAFGTDDDRRVFLRFAPQPNGNWFPWNPQCPWSCSGQKINQTVASYNALWQYVINGHVRSSKYNMTRDVLRVVFDVNNEDAYDAGYTLEQFYPTDGSADWLGATGDNFGNTIPGNTWSTPSQVFSSVVARLRKLNATAPLLLSGGTTSHPNGAWAKYWWIVSFFEYVSSVAQMLLYHNADSSTDIAAFGGEGGLSQWTSPATLVTYNVYQSLADSINNGTYPLIGSNASLPTWITDAAFAGNI